MQGVWVWSMDWELSSQMPQYVAKNLKRKILFFCWFGKLDWCHTLFLNHPRPPQCMGQGGHHCEMLGWCSVPTDVVGCPWNPRRSCCPILRPHGGLCPPFSEAADSWIRSVELEGRILKFPLVEEPKMEQSTSVPPNGTFRQGLGKWTVSCVWKQSLWEFLVRNFKVLVYSASFWNPESLKRQKEVARWRSSPSGGGWGGLLLSAAVPFLQVCGTVCKQAWASLSLLRFFKNNYFLHLFICFHLFYIFGCAGS